METIKIFMWSDGRVAFYWPSTKGDWTVGRGNAGLFLEIKRFLKAVVLTVHE